MERVKRTESTTGFDLLDEIENSLKRGQVFRQELTAEDVLGLFQRILEVDVDGLELKIANREASLKGTIRIESEIARGSLKTEIRLMNDSRSEKHVLGVIDQFDSDIRTSIPLRAGGMDEAIKEGIMGRMFQNGLTDFLSKEMEERGTRVKEMALHLLPEALEVTIS